MTNYIFNEDKALQEIKEYIDGTYSQHYAQNKYQSTDFIVDSGHGEVFCVGNIIKYAQRYGKKDGKNRKDILKVIHYAIILLSVNEKDSTMVADKLDKEV